MYNGESAVKGERASSSLSRATRHGAPAKVAKPELVEKNDSGDDDEQRIEGSVVDDVMHQTGPLPWSDEPTVATSIGQSPVVLHLCPT